MKKIYILIALVCLTISCKKDFIRLSPEDSYTDGVFYKTEQQFRSAVVAAYAPLIIPFINRFQAIEVRQL
jgi:hypothetical protein